LYKREALADKLTHLMLDFLKLESTGPTPQQVARSFRWLGWAGFWLQALLGFIPILVVITTVISRASQQNFLSLGIWLAIACLVALLFSIYWCFRYTQLGKKLEIRDSRPTKAQVIQVLKLGVVTNIGIMVLAVLIALIRVSVLTYKMLTLPQGATVIAPGQMGTTLSPGALITPSNMIAIQAMIHAIAAGLVGVIISLLLLYQVRLHRNANDSV
jgi:hypothetical protein